MKIPTVGGDRFPMSVMKMPEPKEPLYHVHEIHTPPDVAAPWTAYQVAFTAAGSATVAFAQR